MNVSKLQKNERKKEREKDRKHERYIKDGRKKVY